VKLGAVLRAWQGLGYNRRAKFLWQAATVIAREGSFPNTLESLVALPGVGVNTAGAVLVYAYNLPSVFVETNIRTAYIHHFARDEQNVSDRFIRKCLQATLDRERPREFYWALMDYGAYLKTTVRNLSQSRHYTKQSAFTGSKRQIRGAVLRALAGSAQTRAQLQQVVADERLELVLAELCAEGLIRWDGSVYFL
jgi:A/G-specific adenine glycosylase